MNTIRRTNMSATPYRRGGPADAFACATCEFPILGRPTYHVGLAFCCAGCVAGGPCTCSYDEQPAVPELAHECLDVTSLVGKRDLVRAGAEA
jgi:hypothetical protein